MEGSRHAAVHALVFEHRLETPAFDGVNTVIALVEPLLTQDLVELKHIRRIDRIDYDGLS